MVEKGTEVSVVEATPPALELRLTETAIQTIQHNIEMAQKLVIGVLENDIDYGRTPGTPTASLWDPGAAKIMAAFNCYSGHQVLYHTEEDNLISWCIEAQLISRQSQQVIATGVGAASTRETKYKYRWVDKPEEFGYDLEQIKKLKTKQSGRGVLFRIENPEYGELVNTLFQMAAKRAEVDGTKSLPGVGSALKKLFSGGIKSTRKEPDWGGFWGRVAQLGLSEQQVHEMLGVTSVNQWIAQGKTLDQAIRTLSERLSEPAASAAKGEGFRIDLTWLDESKNALKWSDETMKTFLVSQYRVSPQGTLKDIIKRLTRDQAEEFVREIQERVAQKQMELFQ